jgi:hypothetical protein
VYNGHSFAESYLKEYNRWVCTDFMDGVLSVFGKNGQPLNAADLFLLNQYNAFDSTVARVFVNQRWADQLGVGRVDTVVTAQYALCRSSIKDELTPQTILKYRRPPNVEDVREIYTGFLKDRTYLTANVERYLFKPPLAFSLYPTEGASTYLLRRVLFGAMAASLVVWVVLLIIGRHRRPSVADGQEDARPV